MPVQLRLARVFPLGLAYFLAASLCIALTRFDGGIAYLWVATAVLIADLTVRAPSEWRDRVIACAIASFIATGLFGVGWLAAGPLAIVNVGEAMIGAALLRRQGGIAPPLGSLPWMLRFVVPVGIVAPIVMATGYAMAGLLRDLPPGSSFLHALIGHALGNLTFTPLVRSITAGGCGEFIREVRGRGRSEATALIGLVVAVTVLVFAQAQLPLLFLPLLPVILVCFRLGSGGATMAMVLVAVIGGSLTIAGHGPLQLIEVGFGARIQFLQFYLASLTLTALPVAADIGGRAALHRRVKLSEERYRLLAEHSTDILMHTDLDGKLRYISPSIEPVTGHDPAALIGIDASQLVHPSDRSIARQGHLATLAEPARTHSFEYRAMTAAGEQRWFESHARAIVHEDGTIDGVLGIVRDISERKAVERRLSRAALTDPLTGLANRRAFEATVALRLTARSRSDTDCIALFDIDHFKRVNDHYGHDAGDAVLESFAGIMRGIVGANDLVARIGGEEFAIFFTRASIADVLGLCERVRREMAEQVVMFRQHQVRITVSGGIAQLDSRGLEAALREADQALYSAKRGGRDQLALAA